MINASKIKQIFPIAGVHPSDNSIEFVGSKNTKSVIWLQNGCSHYFSDLPIHYFNMIKTAYLRDTKAVNFLSKVTDNVSRQVELFTYYMWGALDGTPDIKDGILAECENFRHNANCPSLLWNSKYINIGQYILTPRQIMIIDLMAKGLPDKAIAYNLGIAHKTLDNHKQKLNKALGVSSKLELLTLAYQSKIVAL